MGVVPFSKPDPRASLRNRYPGSLYNSPHHLLPTSTRDVQPTTHSVIHDIIVEVLRGQTRGSAQSRPVLYHLEHLDTELGPDAPPSDRYHSHTHPCHVLFGSLHGTVRRFYTGVERPSAQVPAITSTGLVSPYCHTRRATDVAVPTTTSDTRFCVSNVGLRPPTLHTDHARVTHD
ncbi:hypothetical protein K439DRAFT_1622787 [Ramaria rubella]|nr:hypothetical protein K439DRAFT_1622787 [Ramaria rubella]